LLAPVRLILLSHGLAAAWIVISFFVGTNSAHADEGDARSLVGAAVSDVVASAISQDANCCQNRE
jgi:hypothetical protein